MIKCGVPRCDSKVRLTVSNMTFPPPFRKLSLMLIYKPREELFLTNP